MSFNSHHRTPSGPHQVPDSDTSSWESDDEEEYEPPVTINPVPTYNPQPQRGMRTVSLGNPTFYDENAQLQRRFALRRRMERFRRYRRQSVNAIQCSQDEPSVEDVPASSSYQVIHPPNFRSLSQPAPKLKLKIEFLSDFFIDIWLFLRFSNFWSNRNFGQIKILVKSKFWSNQYFGQIKILVKSKF